MSDDIDIANDAAEYFRQLALARRPRPTCSVSAQFCEDCDELSRYFVNRRSRVVQPALVVRGCGSGGDE